MIMSRIPSINTFLWDNKQQGESVLLWQWWMGKGLICDPFVFSSGSFWCCATSAVRHVERDVPSTPTHSHHLMSHQHLSQLLHPRPRWAGIFGISYLALFELPVTMNVMVPTPPETFQRPRSLYSKWSNVASDCVMLFTWITQDQPFWHYTWPEVIFRE